MPYRLSEENIKAIEWAINRSGKTEAVVKAEGGKIVVLLAEKKKVISR